jgi:hypothetical protein
MTRLRMHSAFVFWGGKVGSRDFSPLVPNVFPSYSHQVPTRFPKDPKVPSLFPTAPQFYPTQSCIPMYTNWKVGVTFDSIWWLGVQRDVSIGECPMFQNIGDGSINLAPSKKYLSLVSVCHYLLQFLEPLIRMVHHGIDKNSRHFIEPVHTFQPPPLASLVRHLGHLTI